MSVNILFETFSLVAFTGALLLFTLVLFEKTASFNQYYHAKLVMAATLSFCFILSAKAWSQIPPVPTYLEVSPKKTSRTHTLSTELKAEVILPSPIPIRFN